MNHEAVYRTAPATPGLLTTWHLNTMDEMFSEQLFGILAMFLTVQEFGLVKDGVYNTKGIFKYGQFINLDSMK